MKKSIEFIKNNSWILSILLILLDICLVRYLPDSLIRIIYWLILLPVLFGFDVFKGWVSKLLIFCYEAILMFAGFCSASLFWYEESITQFAVELPVQIGFGIISQVLINFIILQPLTFCLIAFVIRKTVDKKRNSKLS